MTTGRSHSAELRFSTIGKGVGVVTMGDDKASPSRPAGSDRELLMAGHSEDIEDPPKLGQPPPSAYHSGREVRCVRFLCFFYRGQILLSHHLRVQSESQSAVDDVGAIFCTVYFCMFIFGFYRLPSLYSLLSQKSCWAAQCFLPSTLTRFFSNSFFKNFFWLVLIPFHPLCCTPLSFSPSTLLCVRLRSLVKFQLRQFFSLLMVFEPGETQLILSCDLALRYPVTNLRVFSFFFCVMFCLMLIPHDDRALFVDSVQYFVY